MTSAPMLAVVDTDLSRALPAFGVSLVAPMRNEAACVNAFVTSAMSALIELGRPFEIICVDDGSTDDTPHLLGRLARGAPHPVRVLRLESGQGQSAALVAGIGKARGAFIALIDADLQNDPRDLGTLFRALEEAPDADAVVGWRGERQDSWLRRCSSRIANRFVLWLLGEPTHDAGCGLKLFKAPVLKALPRFRGMHRLLAPLVRREGGKVVEVAVSHHPRRHGVSKYGSGLGRVLDGLIDALGVWWLQRRRVSPGLPELAPEQAES